MHVNGLLVSTERVLEVAVAKEGVALGIASSDGNRREIKRELTSSFNASDFFRRSAALAVRLACRTESFSWIRDEESGCNGEGAGSLPV